MGCYRGCEGVSLCLSAGGQGAMPHLGLGVSPHSLHGVPRGPLLSVDASLPGVCDKTDFVDGQSLLRWRRKAARGTDFFLGTYGTRLSTRTFGKEYPFHSQGKSTGFRPFLPPGGSRQCGFLERCSCSMGDWPHHYSTCSYKTERFSHRQPVKIAPWHIDGKWCLFFTRTRTLSYKHSKNDQNRKASLLSKGEAP